MSINELVDEAISSVKRTSGDYGTNEKYEGVFEREVSAIDFLPNNIKVVNNVPDYAMGGGNILGLTFRNQGIINLGTFWGDEAKYEEVLLHEITHNLLEEGYDEMAVRRATAKHLNYVGKETGSHSQYLH